MANKHFKDTHIEQPSEPAGLPGWPHWLADDNQSIKISGRYLTPARNRLAWFISSCLTLAILIFPGWYFWGFENIPYQAFEDVKWVGSKLGDYVWNHTQSLTQEKWTLVGLWLCCWPLLHVWRRLIYTAISPCLRTNTTVRFTKTSILLPRSFGRYFSFDRGAVGEITFVLRQHPDIERLAGKARTPDQATLIREIRVLYLQFGLDLIPFARFAAPEDGDRFVRVCQYALGYQLEAVQTVSRSIRPLRTSGTHI